MDERGSASSSSHDRAAVRRAVRKAGRSGSSGDTERFHRNVGELARDAAGGSEAVAETLLTLVHQYGLARPGVASVFSPGADADDEMAAALSAVERRIDRYEGRSASRTAGPGSGIDLMGRRSPDGPTGRAPRGDRC